MTDGPATRPDGSPAHWHDEDQGGSFAARLNWLRAGVLGANDGIVSTAGLVVGVAGANASRHVIFLTGVAGLVAGALSMAVGEYVSVSTQRDTERAALANERAALHAMPEEELEELAEAYAAKGLDPDLARQVAEQLTAHDPLAAHAEVELKIDPEEVTQPWQAAFASLIAFSIGALLPLLAVILPPDSLRVPVTLGAVTVALAVTGYVSAWLGKAHRGRAVLRNVIGGALAMGIGYVVGRAIGSPV